MSDVVIKTDGLSKLYRVGGKQEGYRTLRDTLTDAFVSPFRRATKLLRGQAYGAAELDETIWALKDVSFEVRRGEVVGIIGRNGAGKTTLLKILSRITEPTEGQAEIRGRVGSLLEVGTGFHPELTGRENIYLNGAILGMKKVEIARKFDEMVDFAEIEKFIDTPVKHYSSGMYVRLAFAVAAHLEPEILLVDEVLAVGDASFQKKCLGKMGEVSREGRTVLFVSHNMSAVRSLCSRCLFLKEGVLYLDGDTDDVVSSYLTEILPSRSYAQDTSRANRLPNVGTKLRILQVEIHPRRETLRFREPIQITLRAKALESVDDVVFGVGVNTVQGVRLLTVESESAFKVTLAKGEDVSVKVVLPNLSLPPDTYLLAVGARSGGNLSLDSVPEAMVFEIVPKVDELLMARRPNLGLRPDSDWVIVESARVTNK
jgi:lipopolysaccharide transport system ATP-binding protein